MHNKSFTFINASQDREYLNYFLKWYISKYASYNYLVIHLFKKITTEEFKIPPPQKNLSKEVKIQTVKFLNFIKVF